MATEKYWAGLFLRNSFEHHHRKYWCFILQEKWKIFFIIFRPIRNKFNIPSYCSLPNQKIIGLFTWVGNAVALLFDSPACSAFLQILRHQSLFSSPVWENWKSFVLLTNMTSHNILLKAKKVLFLNTKIGIPVNSPWAEESSLKY